MGNLLQLASAAIIDLAIGFLLGWHCATRQFRKRSQANIPSSATVASHAHDVHEFESILIGVRRELMQHSDELERFDRGLSHLDGHPSNKLESSSELGDQIASVRAANQQVDQAIGSTIGRLSQYVQVYGDRIAQELRKLSQYQGGTADLEHLLSDPVDALPFEARLDRLVQSVGQLQKQNDELRSDLAMCQHQLVKQIARGDSAEEQARIDTMTQLPNRRAFEEKIAELQSLFERHQANYSLVLFDVDRFKQLNDSHGHPAGDAVLAMIGRVFQATRRGSDHVSRFGGEEFALLIPQSETCNPKKIADRYRTKLEASSLRFGGHELSVTVSVGIASVASGESSRSLVARADDALYSAKERGGNCIVVHESDQEIIKTEQTARVDAGGP